MRLSQVLANSVQAPGQIRRVLEGLKALLGDYEFRFPIPAPEAGEERRDILGNRVSKWHFWGDGASAENRIGELYPGNTKDLDPPITIPLGKTERNDESW